MRKRFGGTGWVEENWKTWITHMPSVKPVPLAPRGDSVSEGESQAEEKWRTVLLHLPFSPLRRANPTPSPGTSTPGSLHSQLWAPPVTVACCAVSQVALVVKRTRLPMLGTKPTQLPPLGWAEPLEEGAAAHSSPCPENPQGQRSLAGYIPSSHEVTKSRTRLSDLAHSAHREKPLVWRELDSA